MIITRATSFSIISLRCLVYLYRISLMNHVKRVLIQLTNPIVWNQLNMHPVILLILREVNATLLKGVIIGGGDTWPPWIVCQWPAYCTTFKQSKKTYLTPASFSILLRNKNATLLYDGGVKIKRNYSENFHHPSLYSILLRNQHTTLL